MVYKESWKQEINKITEDFKKICSDLDYKQLNLKPAPDKWSIAQVIDHLIKTTESYYPVLEDLNNPNRDIPFTGKVNFLVNMFGDFIYKGVNPDRVKKMKTFPVWQPSNSDLPADILKTFEESQNIYINKVEKNQNNFDKRISSPANKWIVYKLGKAVDIFIMHEKRHYNQAVEVLNLLNNKVSN